MSEEDRVVAAENDGEAFEETARDGSSYRLRLVAHDPQAYDWYYNVVANPMLWFLQHHLWDLAVAPSHRPRLAPRVDRGLRAGQPRVRRRGARRARPRSERRRLLPRLPPLPRAALRARRAAGRAPRALRAHPVAAEPTTGRVLPLEIRRAIHDGLLANDVVGFHTRRWRRNFMRVAGGHRRRGRPTGRATCSATRAGASSITAAPISVDPREFDDLAQSQAVLEAGEKLARRPARRS